MSDENASRNMWEGTNNRLRRDVNGLVQTGFKGMQP
jgi:hypothetical protein